MRSFVAAKQKSALGFRGFFAPPTAVGLRVHKLAVKAFSVPFLAKRLVARSVRDNFELPEYLAT